MNPVGELTEMLGYCRPHGSDTEKRFIGKFLEPLGIFTDEAGNVIKQVGDDTNVLWSSHIDTVHRREGIVPILIDGNIARVLQASGASCLGADCTTGVWIMMQMIRAKVPGLYVFHRGEEVGCIGSSHIHRQTPQLLNGIDMAIAFDRYGIDSVITHQMGERTCSDAFANSMIEQLPGFQLDDGGVFTDTYTYIDLVPECTNLSVGYKGQHGMSEIQNLSFAQAMAEHMCSMDTTKLVVERDPSVSDYVSYRRGPSPRGGGWYYDSYMMAGSKPKKSTPTLADLCRKYPDEIADFLESYGISPHELEEHIHEVSYYGG